jgi:hypothetical protein
MSARTILKIVERNRLSVGMRQRVHRIGTALDVRLAGNHLLVRIATREDCANDPSIAVPAAHVTSTATSGRRSNAFFTTTKQGATIPRFFSMLYIATHANRG